MNVTVRKGDTLWYYSQLFNVPLQLILDSNPDVNPRHLNRGQQVKIPGFSAEQYKIQQRDNFWEMATLKEVSIDALMLTNPTVEPRRLEAGGQIQIPQRVTKSIVNWQSEYDYGTLVDNLDRLFEIYPFMKQDHIGNSVMGKSLSEIRIGRGERKVHFNGSFHANEWTTTPIIMKFVNEYLLALTNRGTIRGLYMAPLYEEVTLSIVPMVNPDGVNLVINGPPEEEPYQSMALEINNDHSDFSEWKANIRGVDLNNQFPARWYLEARRKKQKPAPANYPGPEPLSEPETIAMAELTQSRDFDRILALHSQGEENYWGFLGYEPSASRTIVQEYARVSGYEPIQYVDSYAGYKDWFIQEWRRPGFTVEIGTGEKPLPISQFSEIYQECLGIFLASLYLKEYI
ncbi:MAG TPA: M14 family metallopeptidase [Bacillales bacterium]|nr:M14 family metallopeptidase [Bacillales bacterium]